MKTEKEERRQRIIRKFWILTKISILIFVIIATYNMGRLNGLVWGVYAVQKRNNSTVCEFLGKERDTTGFCSLGEGYKYRYYADCGWEKFKLEGEKKPPFLVNLGEELRKWIMYPALGCS